MKTINLYFNFNSLNNINVNYVFKQKLILIICRGGGYQFVLFAFREYSQ